MATLELRIELPDGLAREAEARGLLTSQAIESWLREAIRRPQDGPQGAGDPAVEFEIPPPTEAELRATFEHIRRNHLIRGTGGDHRPELAIEVIDDPDVSARNRDRHGRTERNADWLQSHWDDLRPAAHGKFLVVAGQEAFIAETWQEAWERAKAAHPDDGGAFGQFVRPLPPPATPR